MSVTLERMTWQCIQAVKEHGPHVLDRIQCLDVQPGCILPSELLLFISAALSQRVNRVFESGRKFGYSTECLCLWRRWSVRSCDLRQNYGRDQYLDDKYINLILVNGDGCTIVPKWVHSQVGSSNRVAVLLDGPKGEAAIELAHRLLPHVAMVAIHDVVNPPKEVNSGDANVWTRIPAWTEQWGHLDEPCWRAGGYVSRTEMTADSSGLLLLPGEDWLP